MIKLTKTPDVHVGLTDNSMYRDFGSRLLSVIFQLLMSKAYGKTPTFSTNFDFTTTAQKNSYLLWQNKEICILSFMRSDKKNSTCMVNIQRQSMITHNGSWMIMFSRFASVLQIAFSKKPPNVVPHVFVMLSLRQRKQGNFVKPPW